MVKRQQKCLRERAICQTNLKSAMAFSERTKALVKICVLRSASQYGKFMVVGVLSTGLLEVHDDLSRDEAKWQVSEMSPRLTCHENIEGRDFLE